MLGQKKWFWFWDTPFIYKHLTTRTNLFKRFFAVVVGMGLSVSILSKDKRACWPLYRRRRDDFQLFWSNHAVYRDILGDFNWKKFNVTLKHTHTLL